MLGGVQPGPQRLEQMVIGFRRRIVCAFLGALRLQRGFYEPDGLLILCVILRLSCATPCAVLVDAGRNVADQRPLAAPPWAPAGTAALETGAGVHGVRGALRGVGTV